MNLKIAAALLASCVMILGSLPTSAPAQGANRDCGKIGDVPVHAHRITCEAARRIYKANMRGDLPRGWVCSASLARCYKGDFDSGRFMWWRRTVY